MVVAGTYDEVIVDFNVPAGKFATICLPFAFTKADLGEGVKVWEYAAYEDGNIMLETADDFDLTNYCQPYVIYAENGINGLAFQNVNIISENEEPGDCVVGGESGDATFYGTYVKMPAGTLTGYYGVTPAGKIQKAGAGASLKAFRGYFELPANAQNVKISFDGQEATGIEAAEVMEALTGEMYDLQGRRVNNAQKGIYIQNGKKFVVK